MSEVKVVKVCKVHGDLTEEMVLTHKRSDRPGQNKKVCKKCKLEKDRKWNEANKEKRVEMSTQWRQNNKDKVNEYMREYRKENKQT